MFLAVKESRVIKYPFVIPTKICLPASFRQPPYTKRNDSALGTQQHTHQQISSIAEVR